MTARRLGSRHVNGMSANGHSVQNGHLVGGEAGQLMRFYPESMPVFSHEPTREHFAIQPISDDCGEGVVALRPFKTGEIVFAFSGFYSSDITLFTLQVKPGLYLHDPFFMGKILHRCDPNCDVDMETRLFTARRDINPGDWVTMNYEQTEDHLYRPFICNCGVMPCSGLEPNRVIRGRCASEEAGQPEPVKAPDRIVDFEALNITR